MPRYAFIKNGRYIPENVEGIRLIWAEDNHTWFLTISGKLYEETSTLGNFEIHPLFSPLFVRINRYVMVPDEDISEASIEHGVNLADGTHYPTTPTWLPNIISRMGR